nr:MAG TPA_asm: hypothetical protein [Caudoviricetes sp.]
MSTSGPILYKYKYVIVLKWICEFSVVKVKS